MVQNEHDDVWTELWRPWPVVADLLDWTGLDWTSITEQGAAHVFLYDE